MTRILAGRILGMLVVLLLVTVGTFLLIHLAPGGPSVMVNPDLSREDMLRIQRNLGLDQPLHVQYGRWLGTLLRGDLGFSLNFGGRVSALIWERLPNTVYLGLVAFLFSTALGVSLGVLSALRPRSALDYSVTTTPVTPAVLVRSPAHPGLLRGFAGAAVFGHVPLRR
jgi:peptide/nickel transport system permease protein